MVSQLVGEGGLDAGWLVFLMFLCLNFFGLVGWLRLWDEGGRTGYWWG